MDTIIERVAGLDIGKRSLTACVRTPDGRGGRRTQVRPCRTMTRDLLALRGWLVAEKVSVVGMEPTSTDWKPPFYLLEDTVECWLLNASTSRRCRGARPTSRTRSGSPSSSSVGWCGRASCPRRRPAGCAISLGTGRR